MVAGLIIECFYSSLVYMHRSFDAKRFLARHELLVPLVQEFEASGKSPSIVKPRYQSRDNKMSPIINFAKHIRNFTFIPDNSSEGANLTSSASCNKLLVYHMVGCSLYFRNK